MLAAPVVAVCPGVAVLLGLLGAAVFLVITLFMKIPVSRDRSIPVGNFSLGTLYEAAARCARNPGACRTRWRPHPSG
ncbi:phosphate/sulfate permease [Streptomyces nodosus]|nr:phosphate/sulfate permease [Streptomyces nodosus]